MENILVDGLLQCLAGFEFRYIGGTNVNFFASPWITARCRFAMRNAKGSEADKPNFTAVAEGGRNGINDGINGLGGIGFR